MERPAYLRQDLFERIITDLNPLQPKDLAKRLRACGYRVQDTQDRAELIQIVLQRPSMYLAEIGILSDKDVLKNLFIEFNDGGLDDGHTYLIDAEAAVGIANNEPAILLRSGKAGAMVTRRRIEQAFREGCVLDYYQDRANRQA